MFAVLYSPVSRIFPWPSSLCRRFLCRVSPGTRTCASGCVCGDASSRLASSPAPDTQLRRHPRCVPPAKLFRHTVESSSREDEKQRARKHPSWPSFTSLFTFFLLNENNSLLCFPGLQLCSPAFLLLSDRV